MNREFALTPVKSYKTADTARAAVKKTGDEIYRHFIAKDPVNGRYFPVFVGQDPLTNGVHFRWNVIA